MLPAIVLGVGASALGSISPAGVVDTDTQGTWKGVYGADGYILFYFNGTPGSGAGSNVASLPGYISSYSTNALFGWVFAVDTSNAYDLQQPSGSYRNVGCLYTSGTGTITLVPSQTQDFTLRLYLRDYDASGRWDTISFTGAGLTGTDLIQCTAGKWVSYPVHATVGTDIVISLEWSSGPHSVISAIMFDADTTAPAAVSNLATSSPTASSITLTWTAPGDDGSTGTAASYDIRYSTSAINEGNWASATQVTGEPTPAAAGTGQNMAVSGLSGDTTYYFAMKTSDEVPNVSAISNCPSGTTSDAVAPAAVSNLATSNPTFTSLTLTWTAPGDDGSTGTAASYDIRYSTSAINEGNWASATQVIGEPTPAAGGTNQSMVVSGLSGDTTYYFAMKTSDEVPNTSAISNSPSGTTSDTEAPAAVSNLATSSPTASSITLAWTAPGDDGSTGTAASYDIRYSTSAINEGNWASATQVTGEPTPSVAGTNQNLLVSDLNADTTYYFAIKTSDEVPNISAISNCPSGTTAASSGGITPAGTIDTATQGTWKGVYGADGYILFFFNGTPGSGSGSNVASLPDYISSYSTNALFGWVFAVDTTNAYDLQQPSGSYRNVGCLYTSGTGTITLVPSQTEDFILRLYLRDYDVSGRWDTISFTGAGLTGTDLIECTAGKWVSYPVHATVGTDIVISLEWSSGPHSVISAILFDPISAQDTTAPAAVSNLATGSPTSTSLTLSWTAPGDDGSTGTAASYDIRYSTSAINEGNWASATQVTGEPTPAAAGTNQNMIINDLSASTTYYFAIKTSDEVPNTSAISNSPSGTTAASGAITPAGTIDTATQGTWKGVYGADGYILFFFNGTPGSGSGGDVASLPGYISSYSTNALFGWVFAVDTTNAYDLQQPSGSYRNVGCLYTSGSGAITLVPSQTKDFTLRLYLRDYDASGRWDTISFTGAGLTGTDLIQCTAGKWVSYPVHATVGTDIVINLEWSSGPHSVISAILFDSSSDTTAPAAVSNLATGSPTSTSLTLSWTAPGDDNGTGTATTYDIRYRTGGAIDAGNWASATQVTGEPTPQVAGTNQNKVVTGLSAGTTYYFAIKTADEVPNWSGLSNSPSGQTSSADSTAPAAVTNLATSSPTTSSITLSWTAPGDDGSTGTASSYDIRYSTSAINDGNWASATQATGEPAPAVAGTNQNMVVSGLSAGTTYYFAIKTSDEVPNTSAISNSPSGTTTASDATAPAAVSNLATSNPTSSSITLTWTAPGDDGSTGTAASYDIRYRTGGAVTDGNWASATPVPGEPTPAIAGTAQNMTVSGLSPSTTYYFAIKTADEVPNVSAISNSPSGTTSAAGASTIIALKRNAGLLLGGAIDARFTGASVVTTTVQDAQIYGVQTSRWMNGGTTEVTAGGASGASWVTYKYDLASVPAYAKINLAQLRLYANGGVGTPSMAVIYTHDWTEGTKAGDYPGAAGGITYWAPIGYNTYHDQDPSGAAAGSESWGAWGPNSDSGLDVAVDAGPLVDPSPWSGGYYVYNVTAHVQTWVRGIRPNLGWIQWDHSHISLSESGSDTQPVLFIDYALEGDTTAPATIANLATSNVTSRSVMLSWTAPGDDGSTGTASSYEIRYATSSITAASWALATPLTGVPAPQTAGTGQSVVVDGLFGNVTYYFAIKTSDEVPNVTPLSNVVSVQTPADTVAPAAVSNLAAGSATNHSLTLTWTAPGDDGASTGAATTYDIRYSTGTINAGNWDAATQATGEPIPAVGGTGQSLVIDNLNQNTTYYFAMKTSDEVPNTSGLSNVASGQVLADTTAPGAVTSLTVTKTKSSALRLAWIASGDDGTERTATSYDVRYRTGGAVTEGNWASCTQVTGEPAAVQPGYHRTMWISGLSASTTYYVGIKALDEVSNASTIATASAATPAASNLTRPLLQPSDFEYLGAFKLPQWACGYSTAFASGGLAMRRVNGNLQFLSCTHVLADGIYECNFPGWGANESTWPQATLVREWGQAAYGDPPVKPLDYLTSGMSYDQTTGRLYYSFGHVYYVSQVNVPSLGCTVLDEGGPVAVGAWLSQNVGIQVMRGGSLIIPDWFADTYLAGRKLGVGFGGPWSGWSGCSPGPTLAAAHHPDASQTELDTIPLLQYYQDDLAKWATRDADYWMDTGVYNLPDPVGDVGYWTNFDSPGSAVWIDLQDKQGLLYLTTMGHGYMFYDYGMPDAEWYDTWWRVYDPADLAEVAQGNMDAWEPQHDSWQVPFTPLQAKVGASGCAFDAQTRTLFVLAPGSYRIGFEAYPVVHGYHIRE